MKKLLILAYDFPPYVSVGGLRPYNWFRYLKEFGIEPIVVTRQWSNEYGNHLDYIAPGSSDKTLIEKNELGTIIRTPYHPNLSNRLLLKYGDKKFKLLRKGVSGFYEFAQFLYPVGPKSEIYAAARDYLKENNVDAIIATGDPFILFKYADQLSKEFKIPWIADYRDPWSQSFSAKKSSINKKIDWIFESKIVKSAQLLITVDKLFKLKLKQLFPKQRILILPNGFDPIEMENVKNLNQNDQILTFSFVGTIYLWHPIERLLEIFANYTKENENKPFLIKFYGINKEEYIQNLIELKYPELLSKVIVIAKLPNGDLLKKVSGDNVLLLFNYYQFTGTKLYDYLALKRKILLCFENDPVADQLKQKYYFKSIETDIYPQIDIIRSTNSGIIVKDSKHLMEVLDELTKEFSETGQIACHSSGVENYSRKIQVEKLAEIVKGLSTNGS